MSTILLNNEFNPSDWISQSEAARIRGVSRQAIHRLIQRGRLTVLEVGGYILVSKDEVENFEALEPGRPSTSKNA